MFCLCATTARQIHTRNTCSCCCRTFDRFFGCCLRVLLVHAALLLEALHVPVGCNSLGAGEHVPVSLFARVLHALRPCLPCPVLPTLVLGAAVVADHVLVVEALSRGPLCEGARTSCSEAVVHVRHSARGLECTVPADVQLGVHVAWPRTQPAVEARVVAQMCSLLRAVVAVVVACCRSLVWWAR